MVDGRVTTNLRHHHALMVTETTVPHHTTLVVTDHPLIIMITATATTNLHHKDVDLPNMAMDITGLEMTTTTADPMIIMITNFHIASRFALSVLFFF